MGLRRNALCCRRRRLVPPVPPPHLAPAPASAFTITGGSFSTLGSSAADAIGNSVTKASIAIALGSPALRRQTVWVLGATIGLGLGTLWLVG